jgi:hypothetical protein
MADFKEEPYSSLVFKILTKKIFKTKIAFCRMKKPDKKLESE